MINAGNEVMTRYLLGQLDDLESRRLEEAFFQDDEVFDRLTVVEEELIDAYLHDELPMEQRQQFERQLEASPKRRSRVETARLLVAEARGGDGTSNSNGGQGGSGGPIGPAGLAGSAGPTNLVDAGGATPGVGAGATGGDLPMSKPGRRTLYRALPAAAGLLVALLAGWLWHSSNELAEHRQTVDALKLELEVGPVVSEALLVRPTVRSVQENKPAKLHLPTRPRVVELPILLTYGQETYSTFRARLVQDDATGREWIWGGRTLEPERADRGFALLLPSQELAPGTYTLEVWGEDDSETGDSLGTSRLTVVAPAQP